jgi:ABC-2 type transport system permease protein
MSIDFGVVKAIFRRELGSYLGNPAGYVFLTLFIAGTAWAAFLREGFFARNLADLALLNQLMPAILTLFIPAITMNVWAEERRMGTDELLLTNPVRDSEVILGKYLGALGVYTVALGFSLAHVFVLNSLGSPDGGLIFSTYLGYWLVGALFISVGLLGSLFSTNATVAFIVGAVGCGAFVFADAMPWSSGIVGTAALAALFALVWLVIRGDAQGTGIAALVGAAVSLFLWLPGTVPAYEDLWSMIGVMPRFSSFGEGIIRLGDVLYFVGGTGLFLYLSGFLLGRRHWS